MELYVFNIHNYSMENIHWASHDKSSILFVILLIYFLVNSQAIRRMSYMKERTHTADALRLMSEEVFNERNGNREEARDVAFIITDGNSNINPDETIARAIEVTSIHKT